MVDDDPSQIRFDPTGQYLIVQITSYNQVDLNPYQGFFPAMSIFTWPDRQLYKTLQFRSPTYNMSRTSGFDFMDNGEGSYDILFPSFSTFGYISEQAPHEGIVRVPMGLHESCTSVLTYGDATQREIPAAIVPIPGTDEHVVANFETGVLTVITPPEKFDYSTAMSVFIEDGHFSSAALINLKDQAQDFQMQSFQTNDSIDINDDVDAGVPFYFVNADGNGEIIPPADVTLAPGQLLVRMYQQLLPEYDKVAGQHGFLKAVSPDQNLQGLVFNGVTSDDGRIIRGDYLKIGQEMYQDSIFPFTQASGSVDTVIHYVNPYLNQTSMVRFLLDPNGGTIENTTLTIGEANGREEHFTGVPFQGYIRVFNQNNLDNYAYMTVEGTDDDGSFMFACPPLDPSLPSSSQAFHVPYYAVGGGYDTSVILISTNQRTDPEQVDENGDPIVLTTHVKMDFYDLQGNYLTTREMDIDNQSRYELYLSMPAALDHNRMATDILTGSVVITVDQDNVCGALTYTQWAQFDNPDDPDNPIFKVQNMAVDKLPLTQDAKTQVVFPYTIGIAPYATSYALYNPGTEPVSVHIEVYNPDGELVGQSEEDQIIPALGDFVYYLGDPAIFGSGFPLEGFVGYMKVTSTSGGAFLGESIQSSPDMLAIIPTF